MSTAVFEHAYYIGNYMAGILYGVDMVMYCMTLRQLVRRKRQNKTWQFFAFYSTALFLLLTIDISVNAVWGEIMWITARDQPGGVPIFIATQLSDWYQAWGSSAAVGLVLMSDALLIYRLFVIYNSSWLVIVIPIMAFLAATVMAILELITSFTPGGFFFGNSSINFGTPYYALTISLNILVTALICYRLLSLSRLIRDTMGNDNAKIYTGVASIMIESALPYSLFGIVFLVPYARGDLVAVALGQVWAKITCLAPHLIIYRVVSEKAWTRETLAGTNTSVGFSTFTARRGPMVETDRTNSSTVAASYQTKRSGMGHSSASLELNELKV
ncbi:hypothetical protein BC835DRAFT_770083 [Cytidiella melzeri]|nr:hypothetical protein BC835DRAFT_770083 [Cytidiella melzeri]